MPRKRTQADASSSKGKAVSSEGQSRRRASLRSAHRERESSPEPEPEQEIPQDDVSPPSPLPWDFENADDDRRYLTFGKRIILISKYIDDATLEHLELSAEVEQYISNIGWREFVSKKLDTYKEITREVMCSFATNATHRHSPTERVISFQCMGVCRKLCLDEVRVIMGFPLTEKWYTPSFNVHEAWNLLTGQTQWKHGMAKSSALMNPALRYIHRVLAHSIFGRALSMGAVSMAEVYVLWCMVTVRQLDGSLFLIRHLATVAGHVSSPIRVGGMVTALAQYFDFNPTEAPVCTKIKGKDRVDLETLENMNMIKKQGNEYYLISKDGMLVPKRVPHHLPSQEVPAEEEGPSEGRMVDMDRDPMYPIVFDVLQKRQWVSAGPPGTVRLEPRRPSNVQIRHDYIPPSATDPNFIPVTPLEGSVYLMALKMDRLAQGLNRFTNMTSQQLAIQDRRYKDLQQHIHRSSQDMHQHIDRSFQAIDQRMDYMFQHLNITGYPPSSTDEPVPPQPPPADPDVPGPSGS